MVREFVVLIAGLLVAHPVQGQQARQFQEAVTAFLVQAPLKISYHYTLTDGEFQQDTTGVMVLVRPSVFRLELWDKVYGSDGASLYLHDRNTHQTVIDSLRWSDVNPWVSLLHGELPSGTVVTAAGFSRKGEMRWELRHNEPWWSGIVAVDTTTWCIREIQLREELGWQHMVRLGVPESWNNTNLDSFITLEDLPGQRLDLR